MCDGGGGGGGGVGGGAVCVCVCMEWVVFLLQSPEMKLVAFLLQFILDEKHLPVM